MEPFSFLFLTYICIGICVLTVVAQTYNKLGLNFFDEASMMFNLPSSEIKGNYVAQSIIMIVVIFFGILTWPIIYQRMNM